MESVATCHGSPRDEVSGARGVLERSEMSFGWVLSEAPSQIGTCKQTPGWERKPAPPGGRCWEREEPSHSKTVLACVQPQRRSERRGAGREEPGQVCG